MVTGSIIVRRAAGRGVDSDGAVARLSDKERAVFLLKHDQGMTYAQVAEALACSVRTAKYRMQAALEQLGREAERLVAGLARALARPERETAS